MIKKFLDCEEYMGRRVVVLNSHKPSYKKLIGKCGVVEKNSSGEIGVSIDGENNLSSNYGVYWFNRDELKILHEYGNEVESMLNGFNYVAIVNLYEDSNKKDYVFALYDAELKKINSDTEYVLVNPKFETNKVLGILQMIVPFEVFLKDEKNKGTKITAQVIGTIDVSDYKERKAEENRLAEVAKKKAEIEKKLNEEIEKRRNLIWYKEMAEKYPELAEMVSELEALGE